MPRVPSRAALAAAALTCSLTLAAASTAQAKDYADSAHIIVPSGQYGSVPVPAAADEQAKLYDSLTPLFDAVTPADLTRTFRSEKFGPGEGTPGPTKAEATPRAGVTITRDRFNVPHIVGKSRDDVTWAMGWVLQEDRGLLLAQGRYLSRLAAIDAPNLDAFRLVQALKTFTPTKSIDRLVTRNGDRALRSAGADGRKLAHDNDVFIDGLNARLRQEGSKQKPFARVDLYAANALIGQIFGKGGGGEAGRAELLSSLRGRLGPARARTLFEDLSEYSDPDHTSTLTKSFPYARIPRDAPGNAAVDSGTLEFTQPAGKPVARIAENTNDQTPHASNFLIVGAKKSATGHPIFVGGPQVGYFYPGLTLEADIKGPGFQARGVYSPANAGNLLIGRGPDFGWSLTSASSDIIDTYAEELCGGSTHRYRYNGKCRAMERVDAGLLAGTGEVVYYRTVHGPVTAYARSEGKPIALSVKRGSYGRDVLFQLPSSDATHGAITSAQTFFKAFSRSPYTFNIGYADDKDIAMYSAGRLPVRDPRVDPRFPTKGTGQYEWKGFLTPAQHPHQVNPPTGQIVNWNNAPAPRWGAPDNNNSYGTTHRVSLLNAELARREKHDAASVTGAMNAAATEDLRNFSLTPTLVRLLDGIPAPSPRARRMLDLLSAWGTGPLRSSRLDRDLDGRMDAGAAPAIMDALYPRLVDAVLTPALGPQTDALKGIVGRANSPATGFTAGGLTYLDKDLRTLLGVKFRQPYRTRFCGDGDINACRTSLWAAIDAAGVELAAQQGTPDPAAWTSDATKERTTFAPGLLQTDIRFTNRPSGVQQVLSFSGHR